LADAGALMRYWFDTEFLEDGRSIDLLSIGIVAEDGRDQYWQSVECNRSRANDWVRENVLPHLEPCECMVDGFSVADEQIPVFDVAHYGHCPWRTRRGIRDALIEFVNPERYGKPEFWGYYADYDWVVVCQLFGRMVDLPRGWPMFAMDLKQLAVSLGDPRLPEEGKDEHHALADAQWNRKAWEFLCDFERARN
jgi:hypothetical protein